MYGREGKAVARGHPPSRALHKKWGLCYAPIPSRLRPPFVRNEPFCKLKVTRKCFSGFLHSYIRLSVALLALNPKHFQTFPVHIYELRVCISFQKILRPPEPFVLFQKGKTLRKCETPTSLCHRGVFQSSIGAVVVLGKIEL